MHISDGVLPAAVWIGGYVAAGGLTAGAARGLRSEDLPRISFMSAAFFVASLIGVPVGVARVHLMLHGLAGILLGYRAFLAIGMGLLFQALLLGYGGVTTLGVAACSMGLPAAALGELYRRWAPGQSDKSRIAGAAGTAGLATLASLAMVAGALLSAGEGFNEVVTFFVIAHLPVIAAEAVIAGVVVSFLQKVKPELLP